MRPLLPTILLATLPLCALGDMPDMPPRLPGAGPSMPADKAPRAIRPPSREQVAMRMMIRQLLLSRYDANHDQKLDGAERRQLMKDAEEARKQQAMAFIRRFDADGDGELSPEDRVAMQQALKKRRREAAPNEGADTPPPPAADRPLPPPRHGRKRGHHSKRPHMPHPAMGKGGQLVAFMVQRLTMDAYDADHNGILDTDESTRLREDGARLLEAREAELLATHDADGDGRLSPPELQAALHEHFPHAPHPRHEEDDAPPPPPPPHRQGSFNRLLDTHFDIDILLNLAHPQD